MNVLMPFDYIYYRVAAYYENNFNNEDRWNALTILSIVQSANLLTIISIVCISRNVEIKLSPFILLILGTLFCFVVNTIRYNNFKKFKDLKKLWGTERKANKNKKGFYIIIYFLVSIVLIIFTMNASIK